MVASHMSYECERWVTLPKYGIGKVDTHADLCESAHPGHVRLEDVSTPTLQELSVAISVCEEGGGGIG